MSTVVVSNVHLDPLGNNRIHRDGSNLSIIANERKIITANSTDLTISNSTSQATFGQSTSGGSSAAVGTFIYTFATPTSSFIEAGYSYSKTTYPALYSAIGDQDGSAFVFSNSTLANSIIVGDAVYGNGIYLLCGTMTGVNNTAIRRSVDGITWTSHTINSTSTTNAFSLAYTNGTFYAYANFVYASTDGQTWATRPLGFSASAGRVIFAGNGIIIATGSDFQDPFTYPVTAVSANGNVWQKYNASVYYTAGVYGNGTFVAVGSNTTSLVIETSSNGSVWTGRTPPMTEAPTTVAYGGGTFVVAGKFGNMGYSKDNGATWYLANSVGSNSGIEEIVYGNGVFIGSSRADVLYSYDGVEWFIPRNNNINSFSAAVYGNSIFVAVQPIVTSNIFVSSTNSSLFYVPVPPSKDFNSPAKYYVKAT